MSWMIRLQWWESNYVVIYECYPNNGDHKKSEVNVHNLYDDFIQWLYTKTLYNDFIQWFYTHAIQRNMDILHWKMITLRLSFIVLAGELCSHTLYCSKATGYAIIHHSQIVLYLERIYKLLWGW